MSPKLAVEIEKQLDNGGSVSLKPRDLRKYFDYRARKLLKMSGAAALKRVRAGKCSSNLAWTELTLLAALIK
jgi:hypothetical protein